MYAVHQIGLPAAAREVSLTARRHVHGLLVAESIQARASLTQTPPDADSALQAPPTLDERPTVLVVEDDAHIAQMLDDLLSSAGYRVLLAYDGATGFARALREQPSIVLSDFILPGMNGGQLIGKLRTTPRTRAIPVALMSNSPTSADQAPGVPFLLKPFAVDELLDMLEQARRSASTLTRYGEG